MNEQATSSRAPRRPDGALLQVGGRYGLLILLVAVLVTFSVWIPDSFFAWDNFRATFALQAIILMVAFGVMLPLVVNEFDLSVGANAGFASVLCVGLSVLQQMPAWVCLTVPVVVSTLIGFINGLLVTKLKVMSFVATLGTATAITGVGLWYTNLSEVRGAAADLTTIGRTQIGGLTLSVIVAAVVAVVLVVVLQYLPVGRRLLAIGANREAARLTGITADRHIIGMFTAAGLVVGIGGTLYGAALGAASNTTGNTLLLPAFAGAFLGSTAIFPGRFNVPGTVIGVFLLAFTVSGLEQVGVAVWIESVVTGFALVVSVAISSWAIRARTAKLREAQLLSLAAKHEDAEKPSGEARGKV